MKQLLFLVAISNIACSTCVRVIGAQYNGKTGVVEYIYPKSPASTLKIKEGDILLSIKPGSDDKVIVSYKHKGVISAEDSDTVCIDHIRDKWE